MAPTITRLICSLALLVSAPMVFFLVMLIGFEVLQLGYSRGEQIVVGSYVISGSFLAGGWVLIWLREIRWTDRRRLGTAGVLIGSVLVAALLSFGFAMVVGEDEAAYYLSGPLWAPLWLFGTALAWRETKAERAERLSAMGLAALPCPSCGYNLAGLRESKCPECGASYTLDQLLAAVQEKARPVGG